MMNALAAAWAVHKQYVPIIEQSVMSKSYKILNDT